MRRWRWTRAAPAPFEWIGTGLLAAMLTSLGLGLQATRAGSMALVGACLVLLVPFVWWQRRAADRSSHSRCSGPSPSWRAACWWHCRTW